MTTLDDLQTLFDGPDAPRPGAAPARTDASIVFVGHAVLTLHAPGKGVYHLPARRHYGTRTRCGITIWDNDQRESPVVGIRRDTAALIARLCQRCEVGR